MTTEGDILEERLQGLAIPHVERECLCLEESISELSTDNKAWN